MIDEFSRAFQNNFILTACLQRRELFKNVLFMLNYSLACQQPLIDSFES